jgi:hypothetical protein
MGWFRRKLIVVSVVIGLRYVIFNVCLLLCYCQIKNIYTHIVFICGIELYVIMYLVYVFIDGVWLSSYCVVYDWDVIYVSCV